MTAAAPIESTVKNTGDGWGTNLIAAICERCDAAYLLPDSAGALLERCPRCCGAALTALPPGEASARLAHPPELAVPFALPESGVDAALLRFAGRIPYPPLDLQPAILRLRAKRVYLPVWLVDVQVQAEWRAEAGFNYDVVSHRDQFAGGGWTSQQVQEQRVRWEMRLGRLGRAYANIAAPALEEHRRLMAELGEYDPSAAGPYQPANVQEALLRAPDRSLQDAWSDARPAIQAAAAEECRQAARADHIRQFAWQPQFSNANWTLLLLPALATFYLDDENLPRPVWVNAQTGQVSGKRRASIRRATRAAGLWLAAALVVFLISVALAAVSVMLPVLLAVAILGFTAAVLAGVAAVIPLFRVWAFNRSQPPE